MKKIPLTQGKFAIVDDEDYDFLMQWKWTLHSCGYAYRSTHLGEKSDKKVIFMHRLLINPPKGIDVDHRDRNKLNNRRKNLRLATRSQNNQNSVSRKKYKGAYFMKRVGKWTSAICVNGRQTHLGYFDTEKDAARAYNAAAKKYFGEFSRINKVV